MIEPLRKGEPYPGRLPPVPDQWARLPLPARAALVGVPAAVVALLLAVSRPAGVAAAVLAAGAGGATVTYVKNRTDRHNSAIDRGEIVVPPDPHIRRVPLETLEPVVLERLAVLGYPLGELARVQRFDGGWLVRPRRGRELCVVVGDDGGVAYYDPRWVPDLRAATEYLAGRGREPPG